MGRSRMPGSVLARAARRSRAVRTRIWIERARNSRLTSARSAARSAMPEGVLDLAFAGRVGDAVGQESHHRDRRQHDDAGANRDAGDDAGRVTRALHLRPSKARAGTAGTPVRRNEPEMVKNVENSRAFALNLAAELHCGREFVRCTLECRCLDLDRRDAASRSPSHRRQRALDPGARRDRGGRGAAGGRDARRCASGWCWRGGRRRRCSTASSAPRTGSPGSRPMSRRCASSPPMPSACSAAGRFGEIEELIVRIGLGEYLAQIARRHPDEPGRDRAAGRSRPVAPPQVAARLHAGGRGS